MKLSFTQKSIEIALGRYRQVGCLGNKYRFWIEDVVQINFLNGFVIVFAQITSCYEESALRCRAYNLRSGVGQLQGKLVLSSTSDL